MFFFIQIREVQKKISGENMEVNIFDWTVKNW